MNIKEINWLKLKYDFLFVLKEFYTQGLLGGIQAILRLKNWPELERRRKLEDSWVFGPGADDFTGMDYLWGNYRQINEIANRILDRDKSPSKS